MRFYYFFFSIFSTVITWVFSKTELVLSPLTGKYVGKYKRSVSLEGCKILTELVFHCCQTVNPVQSQPKFSVQVTKPILAIGQATVEINRAIQSLLKHRPPPSPPNRTSCCLVKKDVKSNWTIRVDCINTGVCCFFLWWCWYHFERMEAVSSSSEEVFRSSCSPCLKRGCSRRYYNALWAWNWLKSY